MPTAPALSSPQASTLEVAAGPAMPVRGISEGMDRLRSPAWLGSGRLREPLRLVEDSSGQHLVLGANSSGLNLFLGSQFQGRNDVAPRLAQ